MALIRALCGSSGGGSMNVQTYTATYGGTPVSVRTQNAIYIMKEMTSSEASYHCGYVENGSLTKFIDNNSSVMYVTIDYSSGTLTITNGNQYYPNMTVLIITLD